MARASKTKDFFISYTKSDRKWAEWIATVLESDGHKTVIQSWDMGPGTNFVLKMHQALVRCRRVLPVYSPAYFASLFTQPEWANGFVLDPTGDKERLFPVRVKPCEPGGLLRSIGYVDLVGLPEKQARETLLIAARPPKRTAGFPGTVIVQRPTHCDRVRKLRNVLRTTLATFIAQCNVRDELVAAIIERTGDVEGLEFEPFFEKHYKGMTDTERRQHGVIRSYTKNVLHDYNTRALKLIHALWATELEIPSIGALERHLKLWLARYKAVIRSPATCLVYVGVEEDAGFPTEIEDELEDYLVKHCGAPPSKRRKPEGRRSGEFMD